ncbi:hypothetical protein JCM8097_001849 [Rhodosporidiobolus ruineniae]
MSLSVLRTSALRTSAARPALARGYAVPSTSFTVQEVGGVKVAAADQGLPTASISVVVKAGARHEPAPGVAHVLKNSLLRSSNKRSAIRLVREAEALGGVLSSSLSREFLVLTAEFLKGDEAFFAEALGDAVTQAKLPLYEYHEDVVPQVAGEYEQAVRNSAVYAFDLAHQLAFRKGLGNSLFASPHTAVDHSAAVSFAKSSFAPSNLAVFGSNVDAGKLKSLVGDFFASSSTASASISTPASQYYGGEVRVPSTGHAEVDQLLIAFKGADSTAVEYDVLRHLLGGDIAVKWGQSASPLAKLRTATSSAQAFNLAYSDAGLFGVSVSAKTADVEGVAQQAIAALKAAAKGASEEQLKQAVAKAKFAAASALETRAGQVEVVGHAVAAHGAAPSLEELFSKLDKVTAESVAKAASSALSSKPTTVAVGNTHALPYADALGLAPPSSSSRPAHSNGPPPSLAPPREGVPPPGGGRGGAGGPRVRVAPGTNTASSTAPGSARPQSNVGARLLKKRQSVAYHHPSAPGGGAGGAGGAPAVPALPPMPAAGAGSLGAPSAPGTGSGGARIPDGRLADGMDQAAPGGPSPPPSTRGQGAQADPARAAEGQLLATGLDVDQLASEGFKPEEFLKQNIPGGPRDASTQMEDYRRLKGRLEAAMKITEGELQKSVFNNYSDFVVISKEIATLENEMLELKGVLEEWRTVPESLEGGWGDDDLLIGGAGGPNRRTQRNSLADLATLYKSQLSALWEGVEGSQKFLPYTPGRHIITEAASFVELNSATYKPKQPVHLFLLNDAMLVTVKKRRGPGIGGPVRLVAERCFNLSEIVVVDLKDGGDLQNAVKIKRGKETIIFRTDKPEDKKMLLLAFKRVAEELMAKKRKEMLNEAEARKGDLRGSGQYLDGSFSSSGFSPAKFLGFGKDDPTGKDLSWIGDFADELAVNIATREFEEGTVLVEKGKQILPQIAGDAHASHLFRARLDQRTSELVSALLNDLSDHAIRKSGVVRTTAWLLRLGQGERARETFLTARGKLVRKRARQIKFEGDISMYISELAMVCFTLIKNTCEWYMAGFKDNRMASGFVRWASEQVEIYAEMFRRQVYGADQDGKVIEESLEVTKTHGAMLRDVGLDFTFLLDGLLRPQKPAAKQRNSSSRLRDESLSGSHLRPGAGQNRSAVALARQSIFQLQTSQGPGDGSRPATPMGDGQGLAVPRLREKVEGEAARGRPASGAGFQREQEGEAK